MWLTRSERIRLLAAHLLRQPSYVPRYLARLPLWSRSPVEAGLPWWSYAAIDRCRKAVRGDSRVFEFGSGGSTVFLAGHAASVECVEDAPDWRKNVELALRERGLRNCTIHSETLPSAPEDEAGWRKYLGHLHGKYDLIVIDGQDLPGLEFGGEGSFRAKCFFYSEAFVAPGGAIVVDDSWRYESLRARSHARKVEVCQSIGPCRYGVTSTDIYYY